MKSVVKSFSSTFIYEGFKDYHIVPTIFSDSRTAHPIFFISFFPYSFELLLFVGDCEKRGGGGGGGGGMPRPPGGGGGGGGGNGNFPREGGGGGGGGGKREEFPAGLSF